MILRGVPGTIRALIIDGDGEPVEDSTVVKVTVVKDSDSSSIVSESEAAGEGEGVFAVELPAITAVDLLTATWATDGGATFTTYEQVVGARLCALADISDGISSSTTPDPATLRSARDIAEPFIEEECGVAFRPRYRKETVDGSGTTKILLKWPKLLALRSVSIGGESIDVEGLTIYPGAGAVWRAEGWPEGAQNVEIAYEHGFTVPPAGAGRVCALLARHLATKRPSNMDDRATSYSTDEAHYTLITPGVRGSLTALPEVNVFIEAWQYPEAY